MFKEKLKKLSKKFHNLKAFSLVELMISLIVISLVAAAFVPVITKKLSTSSIFAGGSGGGFSKSCSHISDECTFCAGDMCLSCDTQCSAGEVLDTATCTCGSNIQYYMPVDGLYVTRFNMGDHKKTQIPSSAGVTVVKAGETCGSGSDYSTKCCWQGAISGSNCNQTNGDYSGCSRTVCNWAAANAICENYKQDNKTWRLPTSKEMSTWYSYSAGKDNDGLMLCDYSDSNSSASYCFYSSLCKGAYQSNTCWPNALWGTAINDTSATKFTLYNAKWATAAGTRTYASSVRCVTEIVQNCKVFAGDTCSSCEDGYYLSGNKCQKLTEVENCETYSKTENKCETCKSGYKLNNNKCEVDSDYYVNINGLLVTKYNMGDNSYTSIPTSAGVSVATTSGTCGSSTNYSTKCCWQGVTSGSSCDSANGNYSGCNRTVCNFAAANAICAKYSQDGRTWRLPTTSEMSNWLTYSKGLETNGLMLCDFSSGKSSSYCNYSGSCKGSLSNGCYPASVWSGSILNSTMAYSYELNSANLRGPNSSNNTYGYSVRCVSELIQNCKTYSGNTCTSCKDGYYLSSGKCLARPTISNCASYSGASCVSCNSGYYLSGGYCYAHSYIANCASMSTTSDICLSCYSGYTLKNNACKKSINCTGSFMQVGNVCVTKYNMGDSTDTAIPSAAGVTVLALGKTCGSSHNYSTKCCWQGTTASSTCDASNGAYSGCSRTVCNWAAANAICANFTKNNVNWRLASTDEMKTWLSYSKGLGSDGLMLCDYNSGYSSAKCYGFSGCNGSDNNYCYPNYVWTNYIVIGSNANNTSVMAHHLKSGVWTTGEGFNATAPFSVRCVTDM